MDLAQFHEELMGITPDAEQQALYNNTTMRGFREDSFNRKRFLAVILLALWLARPHDGVYNKVLLIVPPSHEKWAIETLRVVAKHILMRLKERPGLYDYVVKTISSIQMGSRIFGIEEPTLWVTYGFSPTSPIPAWLPPKVIEVEHVDEPG